MRNQKGQGLVILALVALIPIGVLIFPDFGSPDARIKASIQNLTGEDNPSFELVGEYDSVFRAWVDGETILAGCRNFGDPVCEILE